MPPVFWWIFGGLLPFIFLAGYIHKRRHGPTPLPTQLKRLGLMAAIFWLLMIVAGTFTAAPR